MRSYSVLTIGPNGGATVYRSIRATARALSGVGDDEPRASVTSALARGGDFVGNVWVEATTHPGGIRRPRSDSHDYTPSWNQYF